MTKIHKLPQELVNQIAAGEVIERPASVVKELVDNSLDAGSTKIKIKLKNGGLSLIEIADNGHGIEKEMLATAFELHTTSKISSIEDLNNLLSMGFRGEALSTIVSVANVTASSRYNEAEIAYQVTFEGINPLKITETARDQGTTITVENLFDNVPARKKYLKTAETEYRKVLEILIPYFISNPHVHFVLERDAKTVYNLPVSGEKATLSKVRINDVLKSEFTQELIELFYDGDGIKLSGYVAHPRFNTNRTSSQYLFVNGRPISDRGIYKAVHEGFTRFIPHGQKIPFIVKVDIRSDLVDVNVHPRKEEVRFLNAYRVYSAVERAVATALEKELKKGEVEQYVQRVDSTFTNAQIAVNRLRGEEASNYEENEVFRPTYESAQPVVTYQNDLFNANVADADANKYESQDYVTSSKTEEIKNALQVFGKYIIVEFTDELWMIDQHAAAERITFEKLLKTYNGDISDIQQLLVPYTIELDSLETSFISENVSFFNKLGFEIEIKGNQIDVKSVPVEFEGVDIKAIFDSIFNELNEHERDLTNNFDKAKEDILATVACHSSIRTNQLLHKRECISILEQLLQCDNPYSCPHGRPIIWKQKLTDIDKNFYRTY